MTRITTPSQTVGPFLAIGLNALERHDLAGDRPAAQQIIVSGTVRDGDGTPVPDAVVEIWQADPNGRYAHPEDRQDKALDPNFLGFGRCQTDKQGGFRFTTVKPGRVPGPGNSLQAPHLLVSVFMRGLLRHLVTRIYFSDETANSEDPILALIEDPARRETVIAGSTSASNEYRWDINLQGAHETVFFDC